MPARSLNTSLPCSAKPRLTAFSGLKALAVIGIIACHMGALPGWDLCARMVEVLFWFPDSVWLITIFAQAIPRQPALPAGRLSKPNCPASTPSTLLHSCCSCFCAGLVLPNHRVHLVLRAAEPDIAARLVPKHAVYVQQCIVVFKRSAVLLFHHPRHFPRRRARQSRPPPVSVFALLVAIRLYIEYMRSSYPSYIRLDLHANPLVQALNYSLGFIAGVFFLSPSPLNAVLRQRLSFAAATLLETLFAGLYLAACYSLGGTAYRLFFVLLALPVIYVLAFGRGALSRIISAKPLLWLETVNLEIFMFHSFILYHFPVNADNPWYYAEFAAITLAAAAGFHLLFRRRTQ